MNSKSHKEMYGSVEFVKRHGVFTNEIVSPVGNGTSKKDSGFYGHKNVSGAVKSTGGKPDVMGC